MKKQQLTREQLKAMPNRERIAALTNELNRLSPDMEAVKKLHLEMGDLLMEAINSLTPEDIKHFEDSGNLKRVSVDDRPITSWSRGW